MAEEQNITDFDGIILELQRIEKIETSQEELQNKFSKTNEKVQVIEDSLKEVGQSIGIEETSKKKNVIGGDKLSSTLTTSEKKRYENIGKEFIAGAGKEFENIRKASKFKEMMSTVKQKFNVGITKFKETLKSIKQKKNFIGKLLIIIGLFGTIVALFKEKITSVLPNIGEKIEDIFGAVRECVGNLIANAFKYVTKGIGTIFTNIMQEIVRDVIPKSIGTFFQLTLPNAIVNLYLGILSAFSKDAQSLFDQRIKGDIDKTTDGYAQNAEEELRQKAKMEESEHESLIKQLQQAKTQIDSDTAQLEDFLTIKRDAGVLAFLEHKESKEILGELDKLVEGNQDFRTLIDRGDFNVTYFLEQLKEAKMQGKNLTNQDIFNVLQSSMSPNAIREGFKMNSNSASSIAKFSDALLEMSGVAHNTRQTMDKHISHIEEDIKKSMHEYKQTVTNINADTVISEALAESFSNLVGKIIKFVDGDTLKTIIQNGLNSVNNNFKTFFEGFNETIRSIINSINEHYKTAQIYVEHADSYFQFVKNFLVEKGVNMDGFQDFLNKNKNNIVPSELNAIVNIDLGNSSPQESIIKNVVGEVVSVDNRLHNLMQTTNNKMEEIITKISNIKNLHTNSKDYLEKRLSDKCDPIIDMTKVNAKISTDNRNKINEIERQIKTPYGQPIRESYVAPCLDLS